MKHVIEAMSLSDTPEENIQNLKFHRVNEESNLVVWNFHLNLFPRRTKKKHQNQWVNPQKEYYISEKPKFHCSHPDNCEDPTQASD
jgi:hypothetical protein